MALPTRATVVTGQFLGEGSIYVNVSGATSTNMNTLQYTPNGGIWWGINDPTSNLLKKVGDVTWANIKKIAGVAIANVKKVMGKSTT